MLLSAEPSVLGPLADKASPAPADPPDPSRTLWTDDYANVISIVR
jgi:hypothetical protein